MKTNYAGHNAQYKKNKAEGKHGWDPTPEITQETITTLEKALGVGHAPQKGTLLELGCGAGNIGLWFAQKGYEVYGIDIAPTAIDWAKEKAKEQGLKADFRAGNVVDLKDYKDNFFNFLLDGHCLHCIIGEDRKKFLENSRRILNPGGFLLVNTMCGEITNQEMKKQFDPQSRCIVTKGMTSRYIGLAEDIVNEVKQAGFNVLHWEVEPRKDQDDCETLLVHATKRGS